MTGHWTGIAEAMAAIRGLGDAFSEPVLEDALKKVAKPIVEQIQQNLASHRQTGLTAEDIGMTVSKEGREAGVAQVLIGAHGRKGGRAYILRFLERGTFRQPAMPVMRPAWDASEASYASNMLAELRKAYERGVRRFATRAA